MTNKIFIIFLLIFFTSCSASNKVKFWKDEKTEDQTKRISLFENNKSKISEFNTKVKVSLKDNYQKTNFNNNYNNIKILNYDGKLDKVSEFSFKKFKDLSNLKSDVIVTNKNEIIYYDGNGSIFKLDKDYNLIWKKNYYSKKEKKSKLSLSIATKDNKIIIADNLSYYYVVDSLTGNLLWKKKNTAAFNSQIKIVNNNFYTLDFDNILRCYSLNNGSQIWEYKSENTFIKSSKKMSLVADSKKIIFINSVGDINAIDVETGNLIWQTPTQSSSIYEDSFSTIYSDIVMDNGLIVVSNNQDQFYSIDTETGIIVWKQNISSVIRSSIINKLIFTITTNGFFVIIDKDKGNILRSTNLIKNFPKLEKKLDPRGFIIGKDKIYLTLGNGFLLKIDMIDGVAKSIHKISNKDLSKPYILNKSMTIVSKKSLIKLN